MDSLRNNLPSFTSFTSVEEVKISQKPEHGITSILESDHRRTKSTLRKTLSADMSSKRWRAQNGFSSMSGDEDSNKESKDKDNLSDVWSSILTQKTTEESRLASLPPYIHPLVKRAAHSLSYQSLQTCTESLGSETGLNEHKSFSEPSFNAEDSLEEELGLHKQVNIIQSFEKETSHEKYCSRRLSRRTESQSFPPPLPSLSSQDSGSVHMSKCSKSGRIVLEAISIPSQNNFQAQREDGCLILTFVNKTLSNDEASDDQGEVLKQNKDSVELFDVKELINPESNHEDIDITCEEDEEQDEEEGGNNHSISRESISF